jgi:hypothetical protein
MTWIEHLLHISPDGGDGSLEFLIMAAVVISAAAILLRRRLLPAFRKVTRRAGTESG